MPTTRKRWYDETQQTDTNADVQAGPADTANGDHPTPTRERQETAQVDVMANSERSNMANPPGIESPVSVVEQQKRAALYESNPRSPKRPRLSPMSDVDFADGKKEHAPSPVPSATISPPTLPIPGLVTRPQPVPQPPQASIGNANAQTPKGMPPDHDSSKSGTSTPSPQTRVDNLPILSSLAGQLLTVLAKMTPTETANLASHAAAPNYQEYRTIRTVLDPVVNLYRTGPAFLIPQQLGLTSASQTEILRKANQALWLTSIFSGEVGLRDMDLSFLFNFVPEGGKLLKSLGVICLELKTQAFITARRVRAGDPRIVLADLFPDDMEQRLLARHPGTRNLAPSEQDFLKRLSSRRDILAEDIQLGRLEELQTRYGWAEFSREINTYLYKNYGTGIPSTPSMGITEGPHPSAPSTHGPMQREFSVHDPPMPAETPVSSVLEHPQRPLHSYPRLIPNNKDDWIAQLARASEIALKDFKPQSEPTPPPPVPPVQALPEEVPRETAATTPRMQPQFQHYNPASASVSTKNNSPVTGNLDIPHASQTAPTQVLYERARQAATARANAKTMPKPDSPSQRRPWTPEEESALMTGLDQVKGPHWSQILAMYGRGGSINESLKDRNQVQLKDKARNLKLFFLKNEIEVPYYLKEVTGDLRTRAPGQAEKQERERLQNEENKAHYDGLQGMMALANGTTYDPDDVEVAFDDGDEDTAEDGEEAEIVTALQSRVDMGEVEAMIEGAPQQTDEGSGSDD